MYSRTCIKMCAEYNNSNQKGTIYIAFYKIQNIQTNP